MAADPLTTEGVTRLLSKHLEPGARCLAAVRDPAGNGQETWFLDIVEAGRPRPLVLRRSADGSLGWTDRALEFEVLRAVRRHGFPVPEVLWLETVPSSLGRPYFVMERMPGAALGRTDPTRDSIAEQLGTQLARLHRLPVEGLGLGFEPLASGAAGARAELARWRGRYLSERLEPVPLLAALIACMERTAPTGEEPAALLWGDPGPHNVLTGVGRITALLDWELAHVGHPLDDLGAAVWAARGQLDPEPMVRAYEAEAGVAVDRVALRWFECLACISRSVMVIEGARAFVEGRSSRPALAGLGLHLLAENLERAAGLAGWPAPGTAAAPAAGPAAQGLRPDTAEIARGLERFLDEEVLPTVEDRALRRGLKEGAALLETVALRGDLEPAVQAARVAADSALLEDLAGAGLMGANLEQVAVEAERREELIDLRDRVRAHLLEDLALARTLIKPLDELYSR